MQVKIYSKDDCWGCKKSMAMMDEGGVQYEELSAVDHADELKARDLMSAPVISVVKGEMVVEWAGFQPVKVKQLIEDWKAVVNA